ncbi:MAG: SRPBCC domain-containing protein [Anaerolineae bacterium]|nr:SRPBCC domain-containing protein [Anaerolineae bacterium]
MSQSNPIGKTKSQGWEIGVRRTLPVTLGKAWSMILTALGVAQVDTGELVYKKGIAFETADETRVEIVSYEEGSLMRMRWQPRGWDVSSTLQIRVLPTKTGSTISVHHEQLQDADQREAMRLQWTALLDELRASVTS